MKELINKITSNDNLTTITGFTVTIFVAIVTSLFTIGINKKKTTTETFRKEGIMIQERLLDFWSGVLIYGSDKVFENYRAKAKLDKKMSQQEIFEVVQSESLRYSSRNTIKALATYQRCVYKENLIQKKENRDDKGSYKQLILALRVATSMKVDFTGEKNSVIDLMKIKINDFNLKKEIIAYWYLIYYYIYERIFLIIFSIIGIMATIKLL